MAVTWTKAAGRDAVEAFEAMLRQGDGVTAKMDLERLFGLAERLTAIPHAGKPGVVENTRELAFPNIPYTLVFRVAETVELLRILQNRPDLEEG